MGPDWTPILAWGVGPFCAPITTIFSEADATRLYQVVESFEAAWQSGRQPSMNDFLPTDAPLRQAVLHKLVFVDLEYRLRAGKAVRVETCLARYPELAADHETVIELITWEYTLRRRQDPGVSAAEYRERLPDFALPTEMAERAAELNSLRNDLAASRLPGVEPADLPDAQERLVHATADPIDRPGDDPSDLPEIQ